MAEHASAPLSKIDGERDVMAEIKCEFQFAFSGNSQASSTQPGANSEVSKKSRFQNPFSYLKQSASSSSKEVLSDGGAPATPVDPPSSSSSSGSNSRSKPDYKLPGRLMMTSYRMQFYYHPSMSEGEADAAAFQSLLRRFRTLRRVHEYCTVALGTILRVEKSEKYHSLEVETKDHRKFHLSFHGQPEILLKVHELLVSYAFPSSFEYVFAFCHRLPRSMAILDTTYAAEKSADEWHRDRVNALHKLTSAKKLKHLSLSLTCDNLNWYADVEDTKWLYYVRVCLKATLQIVDLIHLQKASVLVHCSHGWDRTSQLCALAQLCLDPFYRTIQGFQVLIEKDFLSFGHPFQIRLANGAKHTGDYSPIFLQVCCHEYSRS
ncbi:hypothetical protein DYB32_005556 [Aphanomyces invadans]|uniref:Myotubularin phosphatase domain-containing protein n=1 Tax=Aphanomyces invadans TaxID=157072 RepID=A0A418AUA8_9STRA|nr:hypothetical protein DYB32_005556 [Aphanomyces invadans]